MERRTFISGSAAALATTALTACGTGGGHSAAAQAHSPGLSGASSSSLTAMRTTSASGTAGASGPADWTALGRDLDGSLVRPGDAQWKTYKESVRTADGRLPLTQSGFEGFLDTMMTALDPTIAS